MFEHKTCTAVTSRIKQTSQITNRSVTSKSLNAFRSLTVTVRCTVVPMASKQMALRRFGPVIRFKFKVYCPECGMRVQQSDVGEVREMRDVCRTMWRKFMQLDDRHCPLFRTCEVNDHRHCHSDEVPDVPQAPSLWRPMPRLKGRS